MFKSGFGVVHTHKNISKREYVRDKNGRFARIDERKFKGTYKFVDDPKWNQQINADLERIVREPLDENLPSWIYSKPKTASHAMYLKWLDSPSGPFSESYGDTKGTSEVGQFLDIINGEKEFPVYAPNPKRISNEASKPLTPKEIEAMKAWNDDKHFDYNHELIDFETFAKNPKRLTQEQEDKLLDIEIEHGVPAVKEYLKNIFAEYAIKQKAQ